MLLVTALIAGSTGAPGCDKHTGKVQGAQNRSSIPIEQKRASPKGPMKELKVLADGGFSEINQPLVIVAREETVYNALKQLVGGLPDMSPEDFHRSAVIAVFSGQKRTGGYSVKVMQSGDGVIHITEVGPPKGSMVTQVLSSPFRVVAVELDSESGEVNVDLGPGWTRALKRYNVESGEFTMSGGITGRMEKFNLTGNISTLRHENFISVQFALGSTDAKKPRELKTLVTGLVSKDLRVSIPEMNAGTLIDSPHPNLSADGELAKDESELSLQFRPLPTKVADGFVGMGSVTAKSAASAKN
jgi:hypothetical protein